MKSGNKPGFKSMGSSPAKKELIGNQANLPEHLKAKIDAAPGKMYDSPGKMYDSPAKQRSTKGGEGKDQDKIFDKNGKHVGNYVNGKKVMKSTTSAHGQLSDAKREFEQDKKDAKRKKSPAKQKVDPDAPGTPGTAGYEPPVKRSDLDAKGKAIWDAKRAKKKMDRNSASPAKKNGMKYDIKEASNQNLTAKARKHFAENAQHDSKKGSR